jgi:hypothetical protein
VRDRLLSNRDRIRRWERTGRPEHLWPDVPETQVLAGHRVIWNTTAALLGGAREPAVLGMDDTGVRAFGIAAFRAGMGAQLGLWIESGRLNAEASVAELLAEHLRQGRRRAVVMDAGLHELLQAMTGAGMTPTVLKGAHTGHVHFQEPACRVGADLDVLVSPEEYVSAQDVLRSLGYRQRSQPRNAGRSTWYPNDSPVVPWSLEMNHAENPWSVDLHCALERRYFRGVSASMDLATLGRRRVEVAGCAADVLDDPCLAVFLALHGSRELVFPQLIRVVELVLVVRRAAVSATFWPAVDVYLARQRLYRFVAPMFLLADCLSLGAIGAPVLTESRAALSARWHRWLDYLLEQGLTRPHRRTLAERLVWSSSWRDTLRIASDLVWHGEHLPFRERVRLWSEATRALTRWHHLRDLMPWGPRRSRPGGRGMP